MLDGSNDDDGLDDIKYKELFSETYLRPNQGHDVYVIQPGTERL